MADLAQRGFSSFDLGIGEARYKETFCDTVEPLFDCFVGHTPVGQIAAFMLGGLGRAKRSIKQSPGIYTAVRRLRRTFPPRTQSTVIADLIRANADLRSTRLRTRSSMEA